VPVDAVLVDTVPVGSGLPRGGLALAERGRVGRHQRADPGRRLRRTRPALRAVPPDRWARRQGRQRLRGTGGLHLHRPGRPDPLDVPRRTRRRTGEPGRALAVPVSSYPPGTFAVVTTPRAAAKPRATRAAYECDA